MHVTLLTWIFVGVRKRFRPGIGVPHIAVTEFLQHVANELLREGHVGNRVCDLGRRIVFLAIAELQYSLANNKNDLRDIQLINRTAAFYVYTTILRITVTAILSFM